MTAKTRTGQAINVGDIVGIMINTYRNGQVTGGKIAVRGVAKRVYRESDRGHWRVEVEWENKVKGFLYTGKDNWAYASQLTLVKRMHRA